MEIKYKVWFEKEGKVIFGSGRRELLRAVDTYNSLHAAAKHLNMSYRAAWGRLRASEARLGMKLVEPHPTGRALHLTEEARELLKKFDTLDREVRNLINKTAQNMDIIDKAEATPLSDTQKT
jgi:molybdate transport system regulatory protein